jgi:hypothetical protein
MRDALLSSTLLTLLCLAGCSQPQPKVEDAALKDLQARLPGRYDNAGQVRADARSTAAQPVPPLDLLIVSANAAFIGNTVYYVRETASDDPHRVLSQYIWVFGRTIETHNKAAHAGKTEHGGDDPDSSGHLEQHIYRFKEPQRWINVGEQPEMLESMLPDDLQRLTGCELLWTRNSTGFTADRRNSSSCEPQAKFEGQLIEQKIELSDTHLSLLEQLVSADGLSDAPAGSSDPYYRFVRRGSAN